MPGSTLNSISSAGTAAARTGRTRVVLIQEDPADAAWMRSLLETREHPAWSLRHETRFAEALERLTREGAEVIFFDPEIPDGLGSATAEAIRAAAPGAARILLVPPGSPDPLERMGRLAVQDYLVRGNRDQELLMRTLHHARRHQQDQGRLALLQRELRRAREQLEQAEELDPLTRLPNRQGMERAYRRELERASRDGSSLCMVLIDLDHFRRFHESLGDSIGDLILKAVAVHLKGALRKGDVLARIQTDCFLALLPGTRVAEGFLVAERLRLAVAGEPIPLASGDLAVTASLGLVPLESFEETLDILLARGARALAEGRKRGRNRIGRFPGGSEQDAGDGQRNREHALQALRSGKAFRVVKQPIFQLSDQTEVGFEFLSRADLAGLGNPTDFLHLAAEEQILALVDQQCFRGCIQAARSVPSDKICHLNLFPSTLLEVPVGSLLAHLPQTEETHGFCVEISEQQIIGDPSYLLEPVSALRDAGLEIAIDDVGFGRSCLESLILLEPEVIKIDKRFVKGIHRQPGLPRYLQRLLRMAASLGARVVAEGIETEEDLRLLREMGVPFGQGYLWGRPA
ncbi:MAG: EAL domain-containing protein [Planctomycetota bacterium]